MLSFMSLRAQRPASFRNGCLAIASVLLVACGGADTPPPQEASGTTPAPADDQPGAPSPDAAAPPQDTAHLNASAMTQAERDAALEAALAIATASRGTGDPALWTLSDDDTTLHIMGTVHMLRPEVEWRSDAITAAMTAADTIVLEADVNSADAARQMMSFVGEKAIYSNGQTLSKRLSPDQLAELQTALAEIDLPLAAIDNMQPWWAAINIGLFQIQKEGYDPYSGVDHLLEKEAIADGKSMAYLETIDQQLGRIAGLDEATQIDFLMGSIQSIEEGADMLDRLVAEWADGDVVGIGALMANPEMMGSEDVYEAILRARNKDWVPQITAMLETPGTQLIAVGAGHLAGDDSVITLLRAEGYEVTGP